MAHLVNDPGDALTAGLRAAIAEVPPWSVEENPVILKFLADVTHAMKQATSLDEILHAGRRVELDLLVVGRVLDVRESDGAGEARLEVDAYDLRRGEWGSAIASRGRGVRRRWRG